MPSDAWTKFSAETIGQLSRPIDPTVKSFLIQFSQTFDEPEFDEFVDTFAVQGDDISKLAKSGHLNEDEAADLQRLVEDARTRQARQRFDERLAISKTEFARLQSRLVYMDFPIDEAHLLSLRLMVVIDNVEKVANDAMVFSEENRQLQTDGAKGSLSYIRRGLKEFTPEYFPKPTQGRSFDEGQQKFLSDTHNTVDTICDQATEFVSFKHRSELASRLT